MDDVGTDNFMLVLQTQFQLDMLKANGDKCIRMDATYFDEFVSWKQEEEMLISVLVIDEYGEGIPVEWAITNREDTTILIQYMKAIKQKVNSLTPPQWFMSDDADQFLMHSRLYLGVQAPKRFCVHGTLIVLGEGP